MITVAVKVAFALVLIASFPGFSLLVVWILRHKVMPPVFHKIYKVLFAMGEYSKRHYLPQKVGMLSDTLIIALSRRKLLVGATLLTIFSGRLLWSYKSVSDTDVTDATAILTVISILPIATLALLFCGNARVKAMLDCQFCVWIRWIGLGVLLWLGHVQAAEQLSRVFGAGFSHLPLAYGIGTFLAALGFMQLPTTLMLMGFQVILFIVLWSFVKRASDFKKKFTALFVLLAILMSTALSSGAQRVGISASANLIVAEMAYEYDLQNEEVCDGKRDTDRKINFFDSDQSRAFVYSNPAQEFASKGIIKPFGKLTVQDITVRVPVYQGVISCSYKLALAAPSTTRTSGISDSASP